MTVSLPLRRCTVREWRPEDAESLARHADSRAVWRTLRDAFPHPYTLADAQRWIRAAAAARPATQFAIAVGGEAVGGIGLVLGEDVYARSAEIGYWLGEAHWGRGIMTEALGAVTEYAFENFDLCRISAGVFEDNPASARVLERCGYRLEGRLRRAVTKEGRTMDLLLYAVVRD